MGRFTNYLLGGSSNPAVGDGYGAAARSPLSDSSKSSNLQLCTTFEHRPSSSKSARSPDVPPPSRTDYFGPLNPIDFAAKTPQDAFLDPTTNTTEESFFGSSQQKARSPTAGKPVRVANGVRAPRSSLAPNAAVTAPEDSPRPSMESFHTADQLIPLIEVSQTVEEIRWEDYEIPEDLGLLKNDTPREIREIIQESLDEQRAMRASRMQAQAMAKLTNYQKPARKTVVPVIAESSAMASARSTPGSEYTANRSASSLGVSQESDTSLESDAEDDGFLKSPPNSSRQPSAKASQENLSLAETLNPVPSADMTELEGKFQESKMRTRKGYKKFKILPGRKMKDEPTPSFLKVEPTVSECISCFDEISDKRAVGVPCGHKYCSACFEIFISTQIQCEATFPPKCCVSEIPHKTDIPKRTMRAHLSPKVLAQYEEKALEYAVPVANRYFCASPTCAKWINTRIAKRTNGSLECPTCKHKLCTICRGSEHTANEGCPQDYGLDRAIEQAERAGWRRCYNCRNMVERNTGCRHMTCRCRAEFW